jgi:hypothetical protein
MDSSPQERTSASLASLARRTVFFRRDLERIPVKLTHIRRERNS